MKFEIEIDENCTEPVVKVRCRELTPEVIALQKALTAPGVGSQTLVLTKGDTDYFVEASNVLFFETDEGSVSVHTVDNVYRTSLRLYELEKMFPTTFMRVSKSSIVNINKIYSISKDLSGCFICFKDSVKQLYVSRMFYKPLRDRMEERR
ncbi:MAG: LytTR family transcriptional regulator [Lachnospiraceae bacterium]|nr:LytTR family transcriptional regulator [Lachnospiraceae bacterium]